MGEGVLERRLRLHVLASGSKGNCALVEDLVTGRFIMIDCGICRRDVLSRCDELGVDPARVEAVFITHEHTDHTKGLGPVLRWLRTSGQDPVVFATPGTAGDCAELEKAEVDGFPTTLLKLGKPLSVAGFDILPFPTSHDVAEPCGFRIDAGSDALGYMTDTGVVTGEAREALGRCRVLAVEANHDVDMLKDGPYPVWLKARIAGERGHLSNDQSRELVAALSWEGLSHVVAMHASETNNEYPLALAAVASGLADAGCAATPQVATQNAALSFG